MAVRKALQKLGVLAWWVALPGLILYLSRGPRTRAILQSGGKIVVVKGWLSNGKWSLPGGGLHKGEDPLDGALREIREETGLSLERGQLQPLATAPFSYRGIHFLCHYFAAELPTQAPLAAELLEISEARWLNSRECAPKNANPDVLAGLAALEKPVPRRSGGLLQ